MNWIFITVIGYFLNAIAVTIDKVLLTKKIPNPAVYTFFISTLSLLALVLAPFGFTLYSFASIVFALVAGFIFTFALLFMFKAISENEASRITPFMGGLQPVFIVILAFLFLGEILNSQTLIAFVSILAGTIIISWKSGASSKKSYIMAGISTFLFAISYTMNKYVYIEQNFISGFIWTRVGAFIGAMLLLIPSINRADIKKEVTSPKANGGPLFLLGQTSGSASFILINYAISKSSSVAIVNALQGLQYVFLLIIVIALSKKFPQLLEEKMTPKIILQKVAATVCIIFGLFMLFY